MRKLIMAGAGEFQLLDKHKEYIKGPSLTVPNEAYSMKEIFEKFTSNIDLGIMRDAATDSVADHDNEDLEKIGSVDITERMEYLDHVRDQVKELSRTAVTEHAEQVEKKRKKQKLFEDFEKEMDEKRSARGKATFESDNEPSSEAKPAKRSE